MKNKRKIYLSIISIVISIALVIVLLKFSNTEYISNNLSNINYHSYSYAFLVYIIINLIIACRLFYFFSLTNSYGFKSCLDIGVTHAVLLCILPMRLGDLIYPFLVNKYLNKTLASSLYNLVVLRVYDFISAAILFFVLFVFFIFVPVINYYSYFLVFISIIIAYFIMRFFNEIIKIVIWTIEFLNLISLGLKIRKFLSEYESSSEKLSFSDHSIIFIFSIARWLMSGLMLMFICSAIQLNLDVIETIFLTTGMNMAFIIPLQTVGGIGLLESVLAILLNMLGQPIATATANAISIRILWFVLPLILGILWFMARNLIIKKI